MLSGWISRFASHSSAMNAETRIRQTTVEPRFNAEPRYNERYQFSSLSKCMEQNLDAVYNEPISLVLSMALR